MALLLVTRRGGNFHLLIRSSVSVSAVCGSTGYTSNSTATSKCSHPVWCLFQHFNNWFTLDAAKYCRFTKLNSCASSDERLFSSLLELMHEPADSKNPSKPSANIDKFLDALSNKYIWLHFSAAKDISRGQSIGTSRIRDQTDARRKYTFQRQ